MENIPDLSSDLSADMDSDEKQDEPALAHYAKKPPKKSSLSLAVPILAAVFIVIGGLSIFFLQNSLKQSQEKRSQAAVGEAPVTADGCVITGCDGSICTDSVTAQQYQSLMCPNQPANACYNGQVCKIQTTTNKCGWTQSPALAQCLGQAPSPTASCIPLPACANNNPPCELPNANYCQSLTPSPSPSPSSCIRPQCAAPPPGCNYQGGSACSCGTLVCASPSPRVSPAPTCQPVSCPNPPVNCHYVGGNICTSCGTLVCASPTPTSTPTPTGLCTPRPACADGICAPGTLCTCHQNPGDNWCKRGDLNFDGKVDLLDFSIFMQNFLK